MDLYPVLPSRRMMDVKDGIKGMICWINGMTRNWGGMPYFGKMIPIPYKLDEYCVAHKYTYVASEA